MSAIQSANNLENMLQVFNNDLMNGNQREQRKRMEDKLIRMMNAQFGYNGLFFSIEDEDKTSAYNLLKPVILSLYYEEKFERIATLDTKDKYLLDFCDSAIKKYKNEIVESKKGIISYRREYDLAKQEYKTKRKNILNWIFRRKMLKDIKTTLEIKERVYFKQQEMLEATEQNLQLELKIKEKIRTLMGQLSMFGFESESA